MQITEIKNLLGKENLDQHEEFRIIEYLKNKPELISDINIDIGSIHFQYNFDKLIKKLSDYKYFLYHLDQINCDLNKCSIFYHNNLEFRVNKIENITYNNIDFIKNYLQNYFELHKKYIDYQINNWEKTYNIYEGITIDADQGLTTPGEHEKQLKLIKLTIKKLKTFFVQPYFKYSKLNHEEIFITSNYDLIKDRDYKISNLFYYTNEKASIRYDENTINIDTSVKNGKIICEIENKNIVIWGLLNISQVLSKQQDINMRQKSSKILLIEGVPGSGKTNLILHRIDYLIVEEKIESKDILVLMNNEYTESYFKNSLSNSNFQFKNQITILNRFTFFEDIIKNNFLNYNDYYCKNNYNFINMIDKYKILKKQIVEIHKKFNEELKYEYRKLLSQIEILLEEYKKKNNKINEIIIKLEKEISDNEKQKNELKDNFEEEICKESFLGILKLYIINLYEEGITEDIIIILYDTLISLIHNDLNIDNSIYQIIFKDKKRNKFKEIIFKLKKAENKNIKEEVMNIAIIFKGSNITNKQKKIDMVYLEKCLGLINNEFCEWSDVIKFKSILTGIAKLDKNIISNKQTKIEYKNQSLITLNAENNIRNIINEDIEDIDILAIQKLMEYTSNNKGINTLINNIIQKNKSKITLFKTNKKIDINKVDIILNTKGIFSKEILVLIVSYILEIFYKESIFPNFKYILIDEFQDLKIDELFSINEIYGNKLILTGDHYQSYSGNSTEILNMIGLQNNKIEKYSLIENYRNSRQIGIFAEQLINITNGNIKYLKEGVKPQIIIYENINDLLTFIKNKFNKSKKQGIIYEEKTKGKEIYDFLRNSELQTFMPEENNEDKDTIIENFSKVNNLIIDYSLVKGLEFHDVFLIDPEFIKDNDKNKLFVGSTRAINELYLFYSNRSLIPTYIDKNLYDLNELYINH